MSGTSRPRIGLTAWRRQLPTALGERTDLYTLAAEYATSISEAGGVPWIIPHESEPADYLDAIDGLIVTGGGDIAAATYGAADQGTSHDVDRAADDWETKLIRAAQERRLPLLGICRGMQMLAVTQGGRLDQEISGALGHPPLDTLAAEQILEMRHTVSLAAESTLAQVYRQDTRAVNTIHHQAVTDAGDLRVTARNDAGHIEAVETDGSWPAMGVQWHPEKMQTPEEISAEQRLFRHFIGLAKEYARTRERERIASEAKLP